MRKMLWALLGTLVLSACGGAPVTPQPTATEVVITLPETPTLAAPNCTSLTLEPTPDAAVESLFPPVGADEMTGGPSAATVTIIEYGDYQ